MNKLLNALKAATLVSLIGVAAAVFLVLMQISSAVKHADDEARAALNGSQVHLNATFDDAAKVFGELDGRVSKSLDNLDRQVATVGPVVSKVGPVLDGLHSSSVQLGDAIDLTSHRLNDLCPDAKAADAAIHPCGTLADTNRTLATLRGTSGQVEKSLLVFNQHEGDLFIQESAAYSAMNKSVLDFDALVSDKDLKASVHNVATTSGNFAAMTTDGKDWLHQKLHPPKAQGFLGGLDTAGDTAKHWMPSIF